MKVRGVLRRDCDLNGSVNDTSPGGTFIYQIQSDWNQTNTDKKDYIKNKPNIPSKTSDLENDSGFITVDDVPESQIQSDWTQADNTKKDFIKNKPELFDGDYNSLENTPNIPAKISELEIDITTDNIPETDTNMYIPELPTENASNMFLNGEKNWSEVNTDTAVVIEVSDIADFPTTGIREGQLGYYYNDSGIYINNGSNLILNTLYSKLYLNPGLVQYNHAGITLEEMMRVVQLEDEGSAHIIQIIVCPFALVRRPI